MPFFDKNGNMVDSDKVNLDDNGFPRLQDLDDARAPKKKRLLSLPDKISKISIVLAVVVVVLLVVIGMLMLKINSLSKQVTPLPKANKQLDTTQTKYDALEARVQKLEEAAKRKTQPVAASKKLNDQRKKQVR
jgi:predicted PurR-regulated permease PerM